MRPHALIPFLPFLPQCPNIRVLDNLQLVLLVFTLIKVLVEGIGGELDRFRDQTSKVDGDLAHLVHVVGKDLAEGWKHLGRGPLVGCEQVVMQRRSRRG